MRSFITALQFLTRIHLVKQENLTAEDFGRSTRFFPLVGVVLGCLYLLAALACLALLGMPSYTAKAILVILPILLTGGLHCDGFMDAVDGLFSGRSRERMLEIMKDSRAGSFGVVAFGSILLLDWSLLLDLPAPVLLIAVFVMPIIGRMAMLFVVAHFPYARPSGMGQAFAEAADRRAVVIGLVTSLVFALGHRRHRRIARGAYLCLPVWPLCDCEARRPHGRCLRRHRAHDGDARAHRLLPLRRPAV